jgi:hypothetical protein
MMAITTSSSIKVKAGRDGFTVVPGFARRASSPAKWSSHLYDDSGAIV